MFRSFFDHHQVHKELKYATCKKIILERNGIPLMLKNMSALHFMILVFMVLWNVPDWL